eukprot:TRINITY_DN7421_c0_g1_i1.p2 TRINITY_DN7421_c0_g1~~TRINITY_DN7421_c0_g1_i1.p2  ORF type:complete len:221 (+),score=121.32 TRINITY_DN7421_c0_g1_i1:78-665(+)
MADTMETMPVADQYESVDYKNNIVLECSDEIACVLPKKLASFCSKLAEVIQIQDEANGEVQVPLADIKSETINRIFIFLKHHEASWPPKLEISRPLKLSLKETMNGTWDYNTYYLNVLLNNGDVTSCDNIFLVLKATQYLDCEPLMQLACASVANVVREVKSEQDFCDLFQVKEPFTKEEVDKLYEDYEYRDSKK